MPDRHEAAPPPIEPPSRRLLWDVWLRGLALQAAWNPQRMQNLGLAAALAPWLRARAPAVPIVRRICRRHYEYFNTNPYFANFIIGGLMRLEDESLREGGRGARQVVAFRNSVARAFASLGDQLFWLGLQPSLLLAASVLAWAGRPWAGLGLIVLFGLGQLWLRWRALGTGYRLGLDIVDLLSRPAWHRLIRTSQRSGMVLAGILAGVYLEALAETSPGGFRAALWSVGAGGLCGILLHRRLPGELVFLLGIPLALVLAVF
ncbi:MAG: PTS system mannose/fructose/sorbose family transporter subunit IID [Candidatus Krumholzibacteriia bacterium]